MKNKKKQIALIMAAALSVTTVTGPITTVYAQEEQSAPLQQESPVQEKEKAPAITIPETAPDNNTAKEKTAPDSDVTKVQALIDALPTLEDLKAISDREKQNAVYTDLQAAYDAYEALTKEEQTQIKNAEIFQSLFDWFNEQTAVLDVQNNPRVDVSTQRIQISEEDGIKKYQMTNDLGVDEGEAVLYTGTITLTGTAALERDNIHGITVLSGSHNIILDNLTIEAKAYFNTPFLISSGAEVNMTLVGTNSLTINTDYSNFEAALEVSSGAKLTVTKESTGSLKAETTKSNDGAGIGGNALTNGGSGCGEIIINGGTIVASGGPGNGPGIGVASQSDVSPAGRISINGGNVTATGGTKTWGRAGIGGYGYDEVIITITGGTVNATGGNQGAGIGSGDKGSITITGGTVNATGGETGAGIGGGYNSAGGNINITGGTVTAIGGSDRYYGGADIGGDGTGSAGTIAISGGTVHAVTNGIGAGFRGTGGTLSSENDGTAMIYASQLRSKLDSTGFVSGIMFVGRNGTVYGNQNITEDMTIDSGSSLTVPAGATLQVGADAVLTNNGTLTLGAEDCLTGSDIAGDGTFQVVKELTSDNITVPTNLIYDGSDQTEKAKAAISIDADEVESATATICGKEFSVSSALGDAADWKLSLSPTTVKEAGTYTASYTKDSKTISKEFTVAQSDTTFADGITVDKSNKTYTYGDRITVTVKPQATGTTSKMRAFTAPTVNQMALYVGDKQISEAVGVGTDGIYTMTCETNDKGLTIGENTITAKYVGDSNKTDFSDTVTVTLNKKVITSATVNSGVTKVYDGKDTFTDVGLTLNAGDVLSGDTVTATAKGTADNANVGTAKAFTATEVTLGGTHAEYYSLANTDVDGTVAITTATPTVKVTAEKKEPSLFRSIIGDHEDTILLTATITGVTGGTVPTGTVTFKNGETVLADDLEVTDGAASWEWKNPTASNYTITGEFTAKADTNYANAASDSVTFDIDRAEQKALRIENVPEKVTYGDKNFTLTTTGGSGEGAVTYAVTKGDALSVTSAGEVTILKAGKATITATKAGDTNYNVKTDTVEITVAQSDTTFEGGVTLDKKDGTYTYGDRITVTVKPQATGTMPKTRALSAPAANQMALYVGDKQISEAVAVGTDGIYTMTCETNDKDLTIGENTITAKYVGDSNKTDFSDTVTVTLNKKVITSATVNSGVTKVYDGKDTFTDVGLTLNTGDVLSGDTVTATAKGTANNANVGNAKAFTATEVTLGGTHAEYYSLANTDVDGTVAITTATPTVKVTAEKKEPSLFRSIIGNHEDTILLTATITGVTGGTVPTGTITFKNGKTVLTDDVEVTDGVASWEWKNPTASNYTITGEFTAKADTNYANAASDSVTFDIDKTEQKALSIENVPEKVTYGDKNFKLTTTGGSGEGAVTYAVTTGDALSVTSAGEVTTLGVGKATITATKAADTNYDETTATVEITVNAAAPVLTWDKAEQTVTYTGSEALITAPTATGITDGTTPDGTITYTYEKKSLDSSGTAREVGLPANAGTYTVKAHIAAKGNYTEADSTNELTLTIKKAAAPEAKTGEYSVTNKLEKEYIFDLASLLTQGKDFGPVSYAVKSGAATSYYDTVTDQNIKDGKLQLSIKSVDSETEGTVGTIRITISSQNYEDMEAEILVKAINKLVPTVTISGNYSYTYGQALSANELKGDAKDGTTAIPGTLTWSAPETRPAAGTTTAQWTFVPTDNAVYDKVTGTQAITVAKAKPVGEPSYTKVTTSGKTLADAALSIGTITPEGTITWDQADTTEVKQGTEYTWTFTPDDRMNYETLTGKITLWEKTANTTGNGTSDGKDNGTKGNTTTAAKNAAKTGDTAPLALLLGLVGISMTTLLYLAGRKRKTRGNQ